MSLTESAARATRRASKSNFLSLISEVGWFDERSKWPKLATFGMVESQRDIGDHITQETRYFIPTCPVMPNALEKLSDTIGASKMV